MGLKFVHTQLATAGKNDESEVTTPCMHYRPLPGMASCLGTGSGPTLMTGPWARGQREQYSNAKQLAPGPCLKGWRSGQSRLSFCLGRAPWHWDLPRLPWASGGHTPWCRPQGDLSLLVRSLGLPGKNGK